MALYGGRDVNTAAHTAEVDNMFQTWAAVPTSTSTALQHSYFSSQQDFQQIKSYSLRGNVSFYATVFKPVVSCICLCVYVRDKG